MDAGLRWPFVPLRCVKAGRAKRGQPYGWQRCVRGHCSSTPELMKVLVLKEDHDTDTYLEENQTLEGKPDTD